MINKELLEILSCPKCKGEIRLSDDETHIICDKCKLAYTINNNMPIMLIDTAKDVDSLNRDK